MIKAAALILGPLLCGVIFFLVAAPAATPGAYLELADGVYPLSPCRDGVSPAGGVPASAPGGVQAFLLLAGDAVPAPADAQSARLYLKVVNHADPQTDYGRTALPTAVQRLNPRVYKVTTEQVLRWDSRGLMNAVYRQALSLKPGDRATTEVVVELEVPAPAGACRYAVSLGPPATLGDSHETWFTPPQERPR
jgi:hypothetical protein